MNANVNKQRAERVDDLTQLNKPAFAALTGANQVCLVSTHASVFFVTCQTLTNL